ncbi:hypothetical protein LSUE1_G008786 [Lachnellula suecica]|uniref:DUF7820 domain-containing protein n=1 Tax=Lachnellula suecica TaxID=602035 RepID=A0A8T9C3J5_9HELO|nr:hypothetical protein LSUE1_G008786 [Lachnellula suecica]
MAGPDQRDSMGIERRASTRISMQQDDDDYDLQAMGISDGFRPTGGMGGGMGMGHNRIPSQPSQPNNMIAGRRTPPPRPSSTAKPKGIESFALRHDGGMGDTSRHSTVGMNSNAMPLTRSSSISTDVPYVRPESPYRGPAGPSHPYQMYPQESRLARTASIATTSTAAPMTERSYAGPSGPTHPYGMYPQNIVPEAESTRSPSPAAPVPVGFPGLNNNYQRRLGPDGEEIADIIGPDGHTEQLPPYTQYPDDALARKTRPVVVVPVPGAGGIGLATRNPEFASQEDLNSPQSRRSLMSDLSSHQVNTAAMAEAEKPPLKRWQQIAKRKVWQIVPVWVLVLVGVMFILFGIVLGSVFAALKGKHPPNNNRPTHQPQGIQAQSQVSTIVMTTTFDASPFSSVPTGIPTLPTGTYLLPVTVPSASQSSCIVNTAQSNAWSCSIPQSPTPLEIVVTPIPGSSNPLNSNEVLLTTNNTMTAFTYGAQPPIINYQQVLKLVTDSEEPQNGPAWWFQVPYNKLVVLRETDLTATSSKRDIEERQGGGSGNWHDTGDFMRKGVAQPGDKPWFCYWNGTLLETFIYVNQTSAAGSQQSSASAMSATASTTSKSATGTYSSSVPTSSTQGPGFQYSGASQFTPQPPAYPKVVKLEERRIPQGTQSIAPYCVQHTVNSDGTTSPLMNSTGQPVTISLNETEPASYTRRDLPGRNLFDRQAVDKCGCTWEWS